MMGPEAAQLAARFSGLYVGGGYVGPAPPAAPMYAEVAARAHLAPLAQLEPASHAPRWWARLRAALKRPAARPREAEWSVAAAPIIAKEDPDLIAAGPAGGGFALAALPVPRQVPP
jgi:hypothetical protein